MEKLCPLCDDHSHKALYMGIPMRLCSNTNCNCVFGPLAWVMNYIPFTGWFLVYEDSYLGALWHLLTTSKEE